MKNQFRITLYDSFNNNYPLTFDFPYLPSVNDSFDVRGSMFMIKDRMFSVTPLDELIEVELIGIFEGDEARMNYKPIDYEQ